jgi:hypothetical protein
MAWIEGRFLTACCTRDARGSVTTRWLLVLPAVFCCSIVLLCVFPCLLCRNRKGKESGPKLAWGRRRKESVLFKLSGADYGRPLDLNIWEGRSLGLDPDSQSLQGSQVCARGRLGAHPQDPPCWPLDAHPQTLKSHSQLSSSVRQSLYAGKIAKRNRLAQSFHMRRWPLPAGWEHVHAGNMWQRGADILAGVSPYLSKLPSRKAKGSNELALEM